MNLSEMLQADCIDIAKQSWLINQHPPFVVGFKGDNQFPMMLPGFSTTQIIQDRFFEIVKESQDWDGIAIFITNGKREFQIKLILQDQVLTTTADIIDDYGGGISLSEFSSWKNAEDALTDYVNRDLQNAYKRRQSCG